MMLRIATAALAAASLAAAAQAAPVKADVGGQVVNAIPKLPAGYPGGITTIPDIVYSAIPGYRPMTLDLYVPGGGGPKPLVIYVHGGGWIAGHARNSAAFTDFPAVLASLASRGYVVASVNYRLSAEAKAPAATDDVDAAVLWLRVHAADYRIDKARIAIWGGSAGGQLAGLAATDCRPGDGELESDCVQAAAIWYGVFNMATIGGPPPSAAPPPGRAAGGPAAYLGCQPTACADVAAKASPATFVDAKDPPFLLVHGTADRTVPIAQSREMLARLKAAGVQADFLELPDIDHSWIGKTPAETTAAHIKALQATFDFFDATVGKR